MEEFDEVSCKTVDNIRRTCLAVVNNSKSGYNSADLERLSNDDIWLKRFYLQHKNDETKAANMLLECLNWRQQNALNDLKIDSQPRDFLNLGLVYPHSTDKVGHRLIWLHLKNYRKNQNADVKKCFLCWLEMMDKESVYSRVTVVFDMKDAGVMNVDMDAITYLISLFKSYYPYFLECIIVYEMNWLLNGVWKIIKTMLGEKANMIKFVDKKTVFEYLDEATLPPHMGGTSAFKYTYKSEESNNNATAAKKP